MLFYGIIQAQHSSGNSFNSFWVQFFPQKTSEQNTANRALDKREYLLIIMDNFCQCGTKTYVVTPHLNCLNETVRMRGHNIRFQ